MSTLDDRASDEEERHREFSIMSERAKNRKIAFTGACLFCGDDIKAGRFCPGGECKEDHEREQKMKKISGS